jgi:hypothetical protein
MAPHLAEVERVETEAVTLKDKRTDFRKPNP